MLVLGGVRGSIETVRFSPDGRRVAAGGTGRAVGVWDRGAAGVPRRLPSGRVTDLRFGGDGRTVYTAGPAAALAFSPDGPPGPGRPLRPYTDRLDLSADGRLLAAAGRFDLSLNGHRAAVFDVAGDGPPRLLWADPPERTGTLIWGLAWLPGSDRLAVAEWHGEYPGYRARIVIRDGTTGETAASVERGGQPTDRLAAGPDGALVAAAAVCLFAWPGGDFSRDPAVVRNDNPKHFTDLAFHPSGRYLAATSNDETVKLYDTTSWQLATTYTWGIGRLRSIAFSPDGTLAAAGSDTGKVVVWDVDL